MTSSNQDSKNNVSTSVAKLKLKLKCSDSLSDDTQGESTLTLCISVAHASGSWLDDVIRHTADAVDSGFMNEAMADEFLRFLAGYIKVEKVKTEAIQDFITLDL